MQAEQHLRFGPYRLALTTGQLWRGTQAVKLPPKALAVLCLLVTRAGQVVTKEELFQAVWADTVVSDDALTSCMQELRQVLRDDARRPRFIETVHRRGFRFIGKVVSEQLSVGGQEEDENQKSKGKRQNSKVENSLESSVQSLEANREEFDSVMPAKAGTQEPQAPVSGEPSWIPASAGMTQPPATLQNSDPLPHPDQTLDAKGQTLDISAPTRMWSRRSRLLLAVLLVAGTVITVQYLSRPTLNSQSLIPNPQPLPLPDKPSIAVMPFTNMSGDPEQEYFNDGLTDVLITDLSRLSGLFVIARTSAFTYKGKAVKVQEVSRELGVQYVLEGSVQKTDEQVRINAQLVDATTGHHLWAERYDRPLRDIFALQDEIVQKIVMTLQLQLTLREHGILVRKRTDNVEAYDRYLQGLASFFRFTKEAHLQARELFAQAIALDPQYAEAYASLGGMYQMAGFFQWSQDPQRDLEQAFTLAQQAIALDDSLPLAHNVLSIIYLFRRQFEQARAEAERTITLAPNSPLGYRTLAGVLNFTGQAEQAIGMLEQALRFDPRFPLPYQAPLSWAYLGTRQYDKAIALQQKALRHNRNLLESHLILTISYSELGREEEARAEAAQVLCLSPTFSLDVVKQTWPFKDPAAMERTLTALRKAGLK